ncbi:hypothetical protein KO489_00725 [Reinekea forsetii]|nr:hypothetical protein [Reinekea forsetii]
MTNKEKLTAWLERQIKSPRLAMQRFTTGGFIFAGGVMMLILSDQLLSDQLAGEFTALLALFIIGLGALIALRGYLALSLYKVLYYLLSSNSEH